MASDEPFLVKFKNQMYDITAFAHKHPGGTNTLKGLKNTDIDERFANAPPHSDAAMYLMNEYRVTGVASDDSSQRRIRKNINRTDENGNASDTNKVAGNGKAHDLNLEFFGNPDESMEVRLYNIKSVLRVYAKWPVYFWIIS